MNGNNGLEALAALCGGEAAAVNNMENTQSGHRQQTTTNGNNNSNDSSGDNNSNAPVPSYGNQHSAGGGAVRGLPEGFSSQQLQQALQAAAAAQAPGNSGALSAQHLALLSSLSSQAQQAQAPSASANNLMEQLALHRYMQNASSVNHLLQQNPQAQALQALFGQHLQQHNLGGSTQQHTAQVLPPAAGSPVATSTSSKDSMPPPPKSLSLPSTLSTAGLGSNNRPIAPLPGGDISGAAGAMIESGEGGGDKKLQKRAANRRSAQLSRKRKKAFIEELKEENDDLRRKELILKSIPDLIVVFDSTGKLWFVSESVSRFLSFSSTELEGTSFWDRLCDDSVRLLKAAFMDSLAARKEGSDTAPLGNGVWELRLKDSDGSHKVVALNGVVHFSGDRVESVCSIRPCGGLEQPAEKKQKSAQGISKNADATAVSVSTGSGSADTAKLSVEQSKSSSSSFQPPFIRAKPHQSVISNGSSSSSGPGAARLKVKGKLISSARISDGDSVSADSGSSDELGE